MAASSSTSAPVQTIGFQNLLKTPEPVIQTIVLGPSVEMDQLAIDFEKILHMQVIAGTSSLPDPTSTTESSSLDLNLSLVDEDYFAVYPRLCPKECEGLRCIAEKMSSKGCLDKLVNVYVKERKAYVNAHFHKHWSGKISCNDIHKLEWKIVEQRIAYWIRAADNCFRNIFSYEKQLASDIFSGVGNGTGDNCLIATVDDSTTLLLDFAEALSCCHRSPERLQTILLFYKRFSDLMYHIRSIFDSERGIRFQYRGDLILSKFGEVVVMTLSEFEDAVFHDQSNDPLPEGAVHKLTKYVMNYVTMLAVDNGETLSNLITSRPGKFVELLDGLQFPSQPPLGQHLLLIVMLLQQNLLGKSQRYMDPSLSFLFKMNNVHYIAQQIERSVALRGMMGCDYVKKLTENTEEALAGYLRASWDGPLYCLNIEGISVSCGFTSGVSKSAMRERAKTFNSLFKEVQRSQVMWAVPDLELRAKLHQSILHKVIPPYKDFLEKFGSRMERRRCSEKCTPFSVDELETKIMSLFGYHQFF